MKSPASETGQCVPEDPAVLEYAAQMEEGLAWYLGMLAAEMDRVGNSYGADMLRQACHYHRASSIKNCALAITLKVFD